MKNYDVIIAGGGATGFFAAINIAEGNPKLKIAILERGKNVLEKVRISGGGRCNVMHSCFEANELVKNYPRGEKELRGPFHSFGPTETLEWFERHGVKLKTEDDGRMFPVSNSSQTIIDCFLSAAKKLKIDILTGQSLQSIFKSGDYWKVDTSNDNFICKNLILTTGSNPKVWEMLVNLGHAVIPPVASLFTFNIKDPRIKELPGVSANVSVKVHNSSLSSSGPLLITHWGMSGPAILKLSAWGARILAEFNYQFTISINWVDLKTDDAETVLSHFKLSEAKKTIAKRSPFGLPNRLWENLVAASGIPTETKWADINKKQMKDLLTELTASEFKVNGKSTFKEEFVTAGGVDLKEINFKTMESKLHENLYLGGEIVNIDAITGGFNFQNAWTAGFLIASAIKK